jgi:hypothetical protein
MSETESPDEAEKLLQLLKEAKSYITRQPHIEDQFLASAKSHEKIIIKLIEKLKDYKTTKTKVSIELNLMERVVLESCMNYVLHLNSLKRMELWLEETRSDFRFDRKDDKK